MFGLGKDGFKRKKYSDIVDSLQARALDTFGEDINLSNSSFLGMFINVIAWALSKIWELAEHVYFSRYVDYAEGNNLDLATRNVGITRLPAERARGVATFTEEAPKGLKLKCNDIIFETIESGSEARIVALEGGVDGNLTSNCGWEIVTPTPDAELVSVSDTTGGKDIETDAELRARFYDSLASAGAGTSNSIVSALLRTEGIRAANIEEVPENDYYKGIRVVVLGGEAEDIGQTISEYKAFGIKTLGEEETIAIANNGDEYPIHFDYANEVEVTIEVEVFSGDAYPTNGDELVATKVEEYIDSLSMGEDVLYSKIIVSALDVAGVRDVGVRLNDTDNNITIGFDEVATANVVIV